MSVTVQDKEGSRCDFGVSLIVCQPACSLQTVSAETVSETLAASDQHIADDDPEPMRISLDFANNDNEEEMIVQEDVQDANCDSVLITGSQHTAATSS